MKKSTKITLVLMVSSILLLEFMGCASRPKSNRVPSSLRDPASQHYELLGGLYVDQLSCKGNSYDIQITNALGTTFGMKVGFNNNGIINARGEYFPPSHVPVMQYRNTSHNESYGNGWQSVHNGLPTYASHPGYYSAGAPGAQFERRVILKRAPLYFSYPHTRENMIPQYVQYPSINPYLSGVDYTRRILWPGTPGHASSDHGAPPRTQFIGEPTEFELRFTEKSLSYVNSTSQSGQRSRFLISDRSMRNLTNQNNYNHYLSVNDLLLEAHNCCKIRRPLSARDACAEGIVNRRRPYSPWNEVEVSR